MMPVRATTSPKAFPASRSSTAMALAVPATGVSSPYAGITRSGSDGRWRGPCGQPPSQPGQPELPCGCGPMLPPEAGIHSWHPLHDAALNQGMAHLRRATGESLPGPPGTRSAILGTRTDSWAQQNGYSVRHGRPCRTTGTGARTADIACRAIAELSPSVMRSRYLSRQVRRLVRQGITEEGATHLRLALTIFQRIGGPGAGRVEGTLRCQQVTPLIRRLGGCRAGNGA